MSILQQKVFLISATSQGTVDLTPEISSTPHVFIGIEFQDGGGSPVTPSGGTYTIDIKPKGSSFEDIGGGNDIDATESPDILSYGTNATDLRYTPDSVTGAVNVQLTVSGNSS